jgi:hypothetical protein
LKDGVEKSNGKSYCLLILLINAKNEKRSLHVDDILMNDDTLLSKLTRLNNL